MKKVLFPCYQWLQFSLNTKKNILNEFIVRRSTPSTGASCLCAIVECTVELRYKRLDLAIKQGAHRQKGTYSTNRTHKRTRVTNAKAPKKKTATTKKLFFCFVFVCVSVRFFKFFFYLFIMLIVN